MEFETPLDLQVQRLDFVVDRMPNPLWHLTNHHNPRAYVLAYVKGGTAHYDFGGHSVSMKKGNVIFIKRNQFYSAQSDPVNPWEFYSCAFTFSFGNEESRTRIELLPNVFTCSDSSRMAENFAELNRVWSVKDPGYLLKCRSLLLDTTYILLSDEARRKNTSAHYSAIARVTETMRLHCDRSYSIEELCAMTGLSSSHFRMLFKQMTGQTAVQYQNRLKVEHAKDLLLSRTCNVTEAAHAVGFGDVFYFSRVFRKLTGKNPSEYLR